MKRWLFMAVAAVISAILFGFCYWQNIRSARVDVSRLTPELIRESGPVLLEGGSVRPDEQGNMGYHLTFYWEESGYLYLPRTPHILINGISPQKEDAYRGGVYPLPQTEDHIYDICILSAGTDFSAYQKAVYLGTFSQIHDFLATSIACNYYIQGLCFAIMLFSFFLFFWKRSEKYLIWLALLAFFVGSYERLQDILQPLTRIAPLGILLSRNGFFYRILNETIIALLQYKTLQKLMPVRIGGRGFLVYVLLSALPGFLFYQDTKLSLIFISLFYIVLYLCFLICFLRLPAGLMLEKRILLTAWFLTAATRLFDQLCELGVIPYGNVDLRLRFRGIVSCIYVIAFFLVACKRFAQKFQEADQLNIHLEEEIQKKSRQQTTFIRSMLHNLKTPLFSLSGYSDMAMKAIEDRPDLARDYIRRIQEKAIYAGHVMDQIFLVTQLETGSIQFQELPVNLADILHSVMDTSRPEAERKKISMSFSGEEDMMARGDPLYLQQAFQNIVDNALIYTPDNGRIAIMGQKEKDSWQVTITDSGCGILPEAQEKIFEAYYSDRPGHVRSSGLGLYITREIIARHGGTIEVTSNPGEGASFILLIPGVCGGTQEEERAGCSGYASSVGSDKI